MKQLWKKKRFSLFNKKNALSWQKHAIRVFYSSIASIGIYGIHHWRIFWSTYRKLAWVEFEPMTIEFCSDALTNGAISPWIQLALRTNFVQLLHRCSMSFYLGYYIHIYIYIYIYIYIHLYFSASFASYFLVSDTQSRTSLMISFNIETLNSGKNPPL